ncbi:hypothetical protein NM688_g395 [Phlebia brevispora]|uniref:Uncharacterized protein n=1 Tax=Phlebia brevispora TaxID=194682 RepID=A0ACC1TEU8_9APHY|nr:hypothetical protein NM688_g395 [Phlebia brevispora]
MNSAFIGVLAFGIFILVTLALLELAIRLKMCRDRLRHRASLPIQTPPRESIMLSRFSTTRPEQSVSEHELSLGRSTNYEGGDQTDWEEIDITDA